MNKSKNVSAIATPILENGDLLSRSQFEQRYQAMPWVKKAELIEGIVYIPSPPRFKSHAEPHANAMGWLWNYKIATPGVRLGDNPTVRLDLDNELQPDAVLLIDPERGGQTRIDEQGYIEGAPELIVEIAASTASIDLRDKKRVYRRNGVKEYVVWQVTSEKPSGPLRDRLNWFSLQGEEYIELLPDAKGIIKSQVFPGLWLSVSALLAGDMQDVLTNLQAGLSSTEHQNFVQQLASFSQP